jgi:RHH-type proline utilization regulon transcriptional repressor/proline dehydrogenase/delta 1-pyrroline-5-carboxylate dehydrogenase
MFRNHIQKEFADVIFPSEPKRQEKLFQSFRKQNIRINLNHLGEAILSEDEAARRLKLYLHDLSKAHIDYISVKISTLYSQINWVAWEKSMEKLAARLRLLYKMAYLHSQKGYAKFVNLDMEEYKDLDLTVSVFKKVLEESEFHSYEAGIVLQAYLPESFAIQKELTEWALDRTKKGGAPIKIRLVKGANLQMEHVESSLKGWALAPYEKKYLTDANYKRMLEYGIQKERLKAVKIGVGSHNLFDISYALLLKAEANDYDGVSFEMLKGMAVSMQDVIRKISGSLLVYSPDAPSQHFQNAVAYLIRRLDENTGENHFLKDLFNLKEKSEKWKNQASYFTVSCQQIDQLTEKKHRTQNRLLPPVRPANQTFIQEPDTDFSLKENRIWAARIYEEGSKKTHSPIPNVISGKDVFQNMQIGRDPSRPAIDYYTYSHADTILAQEALETAHQFHQRWKMTTLEERSHLMAQTAQIIRERRWQMIETMIGDAGKILQEADTEISEAVDFLEYYRRNIDLLNYNDVISWSSKGVVLVAPPWNFPCSIPVGGIAAALITGNCVLFKPAPETVLVGWHVVQTFWDAGIPKQALQFINCPDDPVGSALIQNPLLSTVILTGATSTARLLRRLRPGLDLIAEAGGKNAMILTALCDRDLAIKDLLQSAFGHAGQKCSACSLAIVEKELYEDSQFLTTLKEAAASLIVCSAWNPATKIPPLIRPAQNPLLNALTQLEEGERWLLKPECRVDNSQLWSPGIKIEVKEKSTSHLIEFFGPILTILKAESLDHAIEIVNATPYGLTSGLHSLDEREHEKWKRKIVAGNLYINRTITGAIVGRQPFGGCKESSFGPGLKAGGQNYLSQFVHLKQKADPQEKAPLPQNSVPLLLHVKSWNLSEEESVILKKSAESYAYWNNRFKEPTALSSVLGQDNLFYYVPFEKIYLRVSKNVSLTILQVMLACHICQTPLEISSEIPLPLPKKSYLLESEEFFLKMIRSKKMKRLRLTSAPSEELIREAFFEDTHLISAPVLSTGRFELLHYLREVSLSVDYHRYGNLGLRKIFAS